MGFFNIPFSVILAGATFYGCVIGYDYFEIHAKSETGGRTILIEVRPQDTVLQMKERIEAQTGVQPYQLNLSFNGRDMKDAQTVGYYKIEKGSTVLMRLKQPPSTTSTSTIAPTTVSTSTIITPTTTMSTTTPETLSTREMRFGIFYISLNNI